MKPAGDMLTKALIGFALVLVIQILAKSRLYYISALVPLFPSIGLFSYYFVSVEKGTDQLRETILFGMLSLLPYFFFLASLYFLVKYLDIVVSLICSSIVWFAVAGVQVLLWATHKR
jgi:membrane protein GlpM